jgi:hypothetical protein
MKNKPWMKGLACAVFACGLAVSVQARKEELTLVLVPREEATTKLGMDIASRYPVLLATYRIAPNGAVSLHGWTGEKWVNITLSDYAAGNFFKTGPNSALIVEKAGAPVPEKLVPPVGWCKDVSKITTTQLRPLIHLTGQYFDFGYKDWKWFAKRCGMEIDAINPEGLNMAWYHRRLFENLKSAEQAGADDLQYWVSLRQTVAAELPEAAEEMADPFTNAVPPAVIMGAGDVPEEHMDDGAEKESAEKPNPEEKDEAPDGME